MKEPLTPGELTRLLQQLDIAAEDLVRKKEAVWQEQFAGKELSEDELVLAMIEYPRLMERPILEKGGRAVIGRPPERLLQLL
ncbi:MAG: ArsC/Spx/MgsR family protein [Owenweeksia sp.]|nr:ArsC/Spx/MgsR family protein [Owenweeksia sp.]